MEEIQPQEKSEFQVRVVRIGKIEKHPNADTLSITDVEGYPVVVKTGAFQEGDLAVYVPIDAIVPTDRPEFAFLKKEGKTTHRIKAAKLRGIFSMGLLVPLMKDPGDARVVLGADHDAYIDTLKGALIGVKLGDNMQALLGIEKWIPPEEREANAAAAAPGAQTPKKDRVKLPVYGLDAFRKFGSAFKDGEEVVVTEKIHGMNARFCYSKGRLWVGSHRAMRGASHHRVREFFERLKLKLFNLFGVPHRAHTLAEIGDVWWEVAEKYDLKRKLALKPDYVLFGEIYGEKCQDLTYDSPKGRRFRAFDVYSLEEKRFLNEDEYKNFLHVIGLDLVDDTVPEIYSGPWSEGVRNELIMWANTGRSELNPAQVCEGFVVKPVVERFDPRCGRVAQKYVGEGYLLREQPGASANSKGVRYKEAKKQGFPNGDRVIRPPMACMGGCGRTTEFVDGVEGWGCNQTDCKSYLPPSGAVPPPTEAELGARVAQRMEDAFAKAPGIAAMTPEEFAQWLAGVKVNTNQTPDAVVSRVTEKDLAAMTDAEFDTWRKETIAGVRPEPQDPPPSIPGKQVA